MFFMYFSTTFWTFTFAPMLESLWVSISVLFASFRYTFFDHVSIFIGFGTDFDILSDSCLILFWSQTQRAKHTKTIVFTMNLYVFAHQSNMIYGSFHDLFRYRFWHWFLMNFGIDCLFHVGILLTWSFMFFGSNFVRGFQCCFIDLIRNMSKMGPPISTVFQTLCFTWILDGFW